MRTRSFCRISSMVLALVLLLCLLPIPAHATITSYGDITAYEGKYLDAVNYYGSNYINFGGTLPNGISWSRNPVVSSMGYISGTPESGTAGTYQICLWDRDGEIIFNINVYTYEPMPVVSIDYTNEKLTGLVANVDYAVDSTVVSADGSGDIAIDESWMDGASHDIVKKGDGTTTTDSAPQSLTIPARSAAPNAVAIQPTTIGGFSGIDNTTTVMEYKLFNDSYWTTCTENNVSGLTAGTYNVRFKATDSKFASNAALVNIWEFIPAREGTPNASINYVNEKLTRLVSGTYSFNGGADIFVTDGTYPIDESWMTGQNLSIVKKGDGTTTADSDAQSLPVPARPVAPIVAAIQPTTINGKGGINNTALTMEYKPSIDTVWMACTGSSVTGLDAGTYDVRLKATGSAIKSNAASVTISDFIPTQQEATTNASIDYVNEKLTGLVGGTYSFNNSEDVDVPDDTYLIDESWMTGDELAIVKKGNGTTTIESDAQNLMIPARPEMPADIAGVNETVQGRNDGKITGVTGDMEYSADDGVNWSVYPETEITGLAPGDYLVRVKATDSSFASAPADVTIATGEAQTIVLNVSDVTFSGVTVGYSSPPSARVVTISNSGNTDAVISSVTVSGTAFTISGSGNTVPANGGSIGTWLIQPKAGLSVGTYSETITVTYNDGKTAKASVYFRVNSRTTSRSSSTTKPTKSETKESVKIADTETPKSDSPTHTAFISGFPDGSFRQGENITRAQAAQMFYNLLDDTGASGGGFTDVSPDAWYYKAVTAVSGAGLIDGYSDGSFGAGKAITRAEFIAAAVRFAGKTEIIGATFTDVPDSHWAAGYIALAVSAGYITGYPDGTFRPDSPITRAEAVTIINRILGCGRLAEGSTFTDVSRSHWAYESITAAATEHVH